MEKNKFEDEISSLSKMKSSWDCKYGKLIKFARSYQPTTDLDKLKDVEKRLSDLQNDLRNIGSEYRKSLKDIVDEIEKESKDSVISGLCKSVLDDINDDYARYKGNREQRLRDINDLVEMYKVLKRTPSLSVWGK